VCNGGCPHTNVNCMCFLMLHIIHSHCRFMVSWKKLENYHTNLDNNVRPDRILIRVECKYDNQYVVLLIYQLGTYLNGTRPDPCVFMSYFCVRSVFMYV